MASNFPAPPGIKTYHTHPYAAISASRPALSAAGKVVFITGGSEGLGLAFATHFAAAGCTSLAITGRRQDVLVAAQQKIQAAYPRTRVLALQGDVEDKAAVEGAFKETRETFGCIDVLVNNAGYLPDYHLIGQEPSSAEGEEEQQQQSDWWKAFTTNVLGSHNILSTLVVSHAASPNAVIINLTSAAINVVVPGQSAYAVSKTASVRLFEAFGVENPGFRVVNVAPGVVRTQMYERTRAYLERVGAKALPVDDIELPASYVVWASSPEAEFIKGKFVWVHWDVDELKQVVEASQDPQFLTLAVTGMPAL